MIFRKIIFLSISFSQYDIFTKCIEFVLHTTPINLINSLRSDFIKENKILSSTKQITSITEIEIMKNGIHL